MSRPVHKFLARFKKKPTDADLLHACELVEDAWRGYYNQNLRVKQNVKSLKSPPSEKHA